MKNLFTHLVFEDHPGFVLVRYNDDPRLLKPRLPINLHRQLVWPSHRDLGVATLSDALVLYAEHPGSGYLGDPGDAHDFNEFVVVRRSREPLLEERGGREME